MKISGWLLPIVAFIGLEAMGAEDTCQEDGGPAYCVNAESSPYDYQVSDGYTSGQAPAATTAIAKYRANYLTNLANGNIPVCSLTIADNLPPEPPVPTGTGRTKSGNYSQALTTGTSSYWSLDWSLSQETQSTRIPLTVTLVSGTDSSAPCEHTRTHGAYLTRHRQVACPDAGLYRPNSSGTPNSYCWRPAVSRDWMKAMGPQCPSTPNPANIATGNKFHTESDYAGPGSFPLQFVRYYNNQLWRSAAPHSRGFSSNLGPNWRSNYDRAIRHEVSVLQSTVYAFRHDGRRLFFHPVGGQFVPDGDIADRLVRLVDDGGNTTGWQYTVAASEEVEAYDANGRLVSIANRAGLTQTLSYDTSGRLANVADSFGHQLQFSYNTENQLETMTDPSGQVFTYAFNTVGNVNQVIYPDTTSRSYFYGESMHISGNAPYAMTGIQDEAGIRFATYKYDHAQRVVSTEHAGGSDKYSLAYGNGNTTVTDPLNTARNYAFTDVQGTGKNTSMSQPCTSGCGGGSAAATSYDANANVASRTDFRGNKTCYAYDVSRNLEMVRLAGLASTLTCPADLSTYMPSAGTRERKIATQWHPTFRLPTQIDEPGKRTTFTHDANGNVLTRTELDTSTNVSRTWTYTYNSYGKVLTADGPRTDVPDATAYTYYNCTTGFQCGQVHTITNAAGHVTTYNNYNAHGQPITMTDPNGVVTTLTYDLRQRLTSRTVGTEVTTFEYWPTGLLKKATLPDGSYLEYTYDAAHRLTDINDADGNRIHYTLDNMGNRIGEQSYDPSEALTRTRTRVFDTLNRLHKEIAAAGTANVTTTYGYDNNGNQTSILAPMGRDTTQGYDELNRLSQVTDPLNGVTHYGYNALDQLISVTDPKGLATSYTYNALGDLEELNSPDTGVTTNTYDAAGNLASSTDARNAIATYTYDALNRVTTAAFSAGGTADQALSYTYDAGTYGKGRLSGISDSSHSLSWTYDEQGRVLTAGQTIGSVSKTMSYAYANGLRQSMTTPSGQVITYGYDNGKITSISVNGTVLASNILYDPFGPVRQWTWSNGSLSVRTFDQDGKITQLDSAGLKTYGYDDAFRITGIIDTANPAFTWTYGYDDLDRLSSASKTGTTLGYTYDANGNRLAETGSSPSTFTVAANSNRLSSTSGSLARTYSYDNGGNTTSFTGVTFTYNNRGRMKSSTKDGVTTDYVYNALGQLIKKGANTLYYYDEAGYIIGIYNGSGALTEEIVWLGDIPIASLRPKTGGSIDIYHIHTDHLNTPRIITDPVSAAERWRWDGEPFGGGSVNNDPSGLGVLEFDLRFPGQIEIAETGLYYNYYRDYDPMTGRYVESDPIGLAGGINTYGYVRANPLSRVDPSGLVDWVGASKGGSLFFLGSTYFELKTKGCWNGKRGTATVLFIGIGLSVGIDASFSASDVELKDSLLDVHPPIFEGDGVIGNAAFSVFEDTDPRRAFARRQPIRYNVYGCSAIRLGNAGGIGCGTGKGVEFGVGGLYGRSILLESSVEPCDSCE